MVAPDLKIQQLHDAVFDIEDSSQKGEVKYLQIEKGEITTTTNSKKKAPFEEIALLIVSLKKRSI